MPRSLGERGALLVRIHHCELSITVVHPNRLPIIAEIILTSSTLVTAINMWAYQPAFTRSFAEVALPSTVKTSRVSAAFCRHSLSRSSSVTSCFSLASTLAKSYPISPVPIITIFKGVYVN